MTMTLTFVSAFWGDWHRSMFVDMALPSLLAKGNLPAAAAGHRLRFIILAPTSDYSAIGRHPAIAALKALAEVEFQAIDGRDLSDPLVAHAQLWGEVFDQAGPDEVVFVLPPDAVWSSNSIGTLVRLVDEGKRCIFLPTILRAVAETFVAEARLASNGAVINLDGRTLVSLAIRHLHPWSAAQMVDAPYFTRHPEIVLWPVKGRGFLARCLAAHPHVLAPRHVCYDGLNVPSRPEDRPYIHVIDDSDSVFCVALADLGKDAAWYSTPRRAEPLDVGRWWLRFKDSGGDDLAVISARLHWNGGEGAAWATAARRSGVFVARSRMVRVAREIWRFAIEQRCMLAAQVLAVAMESGVLWSILPTVGEDGVAILIPPDDVLLADSDGRAALGGGRDAMIRLVRRHLAAPLPAPVHGGASFECSYGRVYILSAAP